MKTLKKARELGKIAGLNYIYLGNVQEGTNTNCYECHELIVGRRYMGLDRLHLKSNQCPSCSAKISGVWS
jgi:pyruvate formate lyase activating enzyme